MEDGLRIVLRRASVLVGLDCSDVGGLSLHEVLDEGVGGELGDESRFSQLRVSIQTMNDTCYSP